MEEVIFENLVAIQHSASQEVSQIFSSFLLPITC